MIVGFVGTVEGRADGLKEGLLDGRYVGLIDGRNVGESVPLKMLNGATELEMHFEQEDKDTL